MSENTQRVSAAEEPPVPDALYRSVLAALPAGLAVYHLGDPGDPGALRLRYANRTAAEALGVDLPAALNRTVREASPALLETEAAARLAEVARTGTPQAVDVAAAGSGGPRVVGEATAPAEGYVAVLFRAADGGGMDAQFRALVDNLPDLAWSARPDGHIDFYNRRWYEYTGTTPEDMEGWGWQAVHHPDHLDDVVARWRRALEAEEPVEMEFPLRGADGTYRWFLTRIRPLHDAEGRLVRWIGTNTDIDARREAEEARRRSEERVTGILESITDAFFALDAEWRFTYLNPQAEPLLQRRREDLLGKVVWDEFPEAVGTTFEREYRRAAESRTTVHFTEFFAPLDTWFEVRAYPFEGGLSVYFADVTKRKRAEQIAIEAHRELAEANRLLERRVEERTAELRTAYARLNGLINGTPDLIAAIDRDHRVTAFNEPYRESFEAAYPGVELRTGASAEDLLDGYPEELERALEEWGRALAGESFTEVRAHTFDDAALGTRTYELNYFPIRDERGDVVGAGHIVRDVTERVAAEEALRESEARYRTVVAALEEGIVVHAADGTITTSNAAARAILGLTADQLAGRASVDPRWASIREDGTPFPGEEHPAMVALRTGEAQHRVVMGVRTPDGALRWLSVNAVPLFDDEDPARPTGAVASFTDVTERRRAEQELREREAQLRKAQQIAHVGSWHWDMAEDRVAWSDELARIFGRAGAGAEVDFEQYLACLHPDDRAKVQETVEKAVAEEAPYEVLHRVVQPSGEVRWVQGRGEPVLDENGGLAGLQGTAQDVTERHAAEEALERYAAELEERNAELEQFAYVASHDLQEPLRMVASFLQLLQRRYGGELDDTADEYIGYAVDGAQRMQRLIQDLLAYSRVGTRGKAAEPVALGDVLRSVRHDLGPAIEEAGARVVAEDLPTVKADPTQMRQLLQNLLGNALKFRHPERAPEIAVSAERVREGRAPFWRIAVADNGIGIEDRHAERVFQIFQRLHTRDEYEGTGIGLALCKKIVERHGGRIWFDSAPGEGTTFYFTLPASPAA